VVKFLGLAGGFAQEGARSTSGQVGKLTIGLTTAVATRFLVTTLMTQLAVSAMKHKLKYVDQYDDRHGKRRTYYRRSGQRVPIEGEVGSATWLRRYAEIHDSFEKQGLPAAEHETFRFAVQEYLQSRRYTKKSASTQRNYRGALRPLVRVLGDQKITSFTRGSVVRIRDQIAEKSPSMAALTVAVLKLVFEHAYDCDMIDRNPAKGMQGPERDDVTPYRRWTDAEIDLVHEQANPFVRRAMIVLLYTGLRCGDALQLQRGSIKAGATSLVTTKNKKDVYIPLHTHLKAELDRPLPIGSLYLMPNSYGRGTQVQTVRKWFGDFFLAQSVDNPPTTHGLRKNAVTSLVEAGCSAREVQSITGQSMQMIEHYAQEYDRQHLAESAVLKWEEHSRNR